MTPFGLEVAVEGAGLPSTSESLA